MADMPAYYRVQPYVLLSGRVDFTLSEHVLSAFVEETNDGLCRCEIVLENWQSDRADMNLLENRQRLDFGMDVEPVSYTHLDVYKRQSPPRRATSPPSSRSATTG